MEMLKMKTRFGTVLLKKMADGWYALTVQGAAFCVSFKDVGEALDKLCVMVDTRGLAYARVRAQY